MAELKNLLVNGVERINGDLYVSENIHGTASNAVSASFAPYTDRYVNTAAFASTGSSGSLGVKMTLTRAGSDTAQVTATIPVATTTAAGVVTAAQVSSWNGATANSHTHANKAVLDGIIAAKTASWDAAKPGTVTSVAITTSSNYVTVDSAAAITTSGTRKIDLTAATKGKIESGSAAHAWIKANSSSLLEGSPFITGTGTNSAVLKNTEGSATGEAAVAEGYGVQAGGNYSHAEGNYTTALGKGSHAEGYVSDFDRGHIDAREAGSHAGGYVHDYASIYASGTGSHARGYAIGGTDSSGQIRALGEGSHAEGKASSAVIEASGEGSHAEGYARDFMEDLAFSSIEASGTGSHAEGVALQAGSIRATGLGSHAEGLAIDYNSLHAGGVASHAEGINTNAYGSGSHTEGTNTGASGDYSHAEGVDTGASGHSAHAEGNSTEASGRAAHTEGDSTKASGEGSHAEGFNTKASGSYPHAEGINTNAYGSGSHAEGYFTTASNDFEHAQGKYNVTQSNQIFSIGVGTNTNSRSNIVTVLTGSREGIYIKNTGGYTGGAVPSNAKSLKDQLQEIAYVKDPLYTNLDYTGLNVQSGKWTVIDMGNESGTHFIELMNGTLGSNRTQIWAGLIWNIGEETEINFETENGDPILWSESTPSMQPGKTYEFSIMMDSYSTTTCYGLLVEYSA